MLVVILVAVHYAYGTTFVFDKENSPYTFAQNFVLNAGDTLIIKEGTTILLAEGINMVIHGHTFIMGTKDEPVLFKPVAENGDWGKIDISGFGNKFEMKHAVVNNGTIHAINTHVKLTEVEFINNQDLAWNMAIVRIIKGSAEILGCSLHGSYKGEGFLIHESENAIIKDCYFEAIPDAIEFISMKNSLIRKNSFYDIKDDAIDLNHSENILVDSNFINQIEDRGFEIGSETFGSSTNIHVVRNIIAGCDEGVTFKEGSSGEIINCTLFENRIGVTCIEDVPGFGGSEINIENTIISNSLELDIDKDNQSTVNISYSLSDNTWLPGSHNLFDNPGFTNPNEGGFYLTKSSPCIDAGNPDSPVDPDNTTVDMGAVYRDINTSITPNIEVLNTINVFPNPIIEKFTVEFTLLQQSTIIAKVYDLSGKEIETLMHQTVQAGKKKYKFRLNRLNEIPCDILLLRIWINGDSNSFKLVRIGN